MRTHKEGEGKLQPDKRKRRTVQVQLDTGKVDERVIVEFHDAKKNKLSEYFGDWKAELVQALLLRIDLVYEGGKYQLHKQFPELAKAKQFYDGIMLGKYEVFKEMFPERYNVFRLTIESEVLERINQETQADLLKEIKAIRNKLDTLQSATAAPVGLGAPKQLSVPQFALPVDDDDDDFLTVKKDKHAGMIAGNNFLASLKALNG